MTIARLDQLSLEFGDQVLLHAASLSLDSGERVCLIGRNGAGKTSLLRIIAGDIAPDHGEVTLGAGVCVSQLSQALPEETSMRVRDYVAEGLKEIVTLHERYRSLAEQPGDASTLRELETLERRIEAHGGWNIDSRVDAVLSQLQLPGDQTIGQLSGGWQRRVALARALVTEPDLLLLDEPTNHLDLSAIEWLENTIARFAGCVLFITHDRALVRRLATRIVELDRGQLVSFPGSYRNYLAAKEQALQEEAVNNALFDKKLAREEVWIREGIKARRTRNEGRVRALQKLREQRAARVAPVSRARVHIEEADVSGRKVIDAHNVCYGFDDTPLIDGLTLKIRRGDRVGIVGNNGVGKSTLLRLLLGEIAPSQGTVKLGTNLNIAYFDQLRRELDETRTVAETVGDGKEYVQLDGKSRHVVGYLQGFLFSAKRAMTPVAALSGGERNRLILARLFTRPANLLVLDEPTNDLDVETLEVLEERLVAYRGTLIVVSHDREFLDNVVTSILVFEHGNHIVEYPGGYSDWLRRERELAGQQRPRSTPRPSRAGARPTDAPLKPGKLSYKLKRELDLLPDAIAVLEAEVDSLRVRTLETDFYSQLYDNVQIVLDELTRKEQQLEASVERWAELESLQQGN